MFDLNDFDETLPGPFEYDVKRMAASFAIAGRDNGFSGADTRAATLAAVTAYREAMAGFAQMRTLDIWYAQLPEDELMAAVRGTVAEIAQEAKGKQGKKKAKTAEKTAQRGEKTGPQGPHAGQPAGAVQAGRAGRWPVPDRQPAAGHRPRPRPGRHLRHLPRPDRPGDPRPAPRLPGHLAA